MKASVLITTYNQPFSVKLILRALLNQTSKIPFEIIVTHDGSNYDPRNDIGPDIESADVEIRYVWQPHRNIRAAAARNNGIRLARGEILIFLDGDTIPALDFVERHIAAHSRDQCLVSGNRLWRGAIDEGSYSALVGEPPRTMLERLGHGWDTDEESKKREITERARRLAWLESKNPWMACYACNLSVKRSAHVFFDESFIGYAKEDWELAYRLCRKHGYSTVYRDDICVYHLETPGSVGNVFRTGTHESIVAHLRNCFYFFDKCPGLELEDVFWICAGIELDKDTDRWRIILRPACFSHEQLAEKVNRVRKWLDENAIYRSG